MDVTKFIVASRYFANTEMLKGRSWRKKEDGKGRKDCPVPLQKR
jgi:hypothetical protein